MDLNIVTDRTGTNSLKFDFAVERGRPADILPLWVADMDFPVAETIQSALIQRVRHGIFGYTETKQDYFQAVANWFSDNHGWRPSPSWLVKTPGVVFALAMAVKAYTAPDDAVLIQPPVYYPFREVVADNDRTLVENELVLRNGHYEIDFDDLERKFQQEPVKVMLLCSPHNPVGRVWTGDELLRLADLCVKYGVILVADEIHCDFTFPGHPFTAMGSLSGAIRDQLVLCTSPSKTFNIAGLQVSNIFIPNDALREKFQHQMDAAGYSQLNALGLLAAQTAYETGKPWLEEVRAYIYGNLNYLRQYLRERVPQVTLVEPEGTYLLWLDFSATGLCGNALDDFITNRAKLWLDSGRIFGGASGQFQRINIACPRKTLEQALSRLEAAVRSIL